MVIQFRCGKLNYLNYQKSKDAYNVFTGILPSYNKTITSLTTFVYKACEKEETMLNARACTDCRLLEQVQNRCHRTRLSAKPLVLTCRETTEKQKDRTREERKREREREKMEAERQID